MSRKDSDLSGVVDVRYTGGMTMLLLVECAWGAGRGTVRLRVPVLVSDLDLECKLWIKLRLAPMCPWVGTLSLAFVGPPTIKVQLAPYARIRLMRIPVLQVRWWLGGGCWLGGWTPSVYASLFTYPFINSNRVLILCRA
jgi:hypothetical protein